MACPCHTKKTDSPTDYTQLPDAPCEICAEKHFSTAFSLAEEKGYTAVNRQRIIGDLVCAGWHLFDRHPATAERIRDIRHKIQLRQKVYPAEWEIICRDFENILKYRIEEHLTDGEILSFFKGRVYIISNCEYAEKDKIQTGKDDLLIFINKAKSASFYSGHKACFHRDPGESYGTDSDISMRHYYVFDKKLKIDHIPGDFIKKLKKDYDWNYPIEEKAVRSATTGYMVTMYLRYLLPNARITLVNFGYDVKKSSYRCPWHNWEFEAEKLKNMEHICTQ